MTIPEAFQIAFQHHQAGRLAEAEAIYRQILVVQPHHVDALHLLGLIAHQVGRHELAVNMIRQVTALQPDRAEAHCDLGNALSEMRRLHESIVAYRKAIALKPNFAAAQNNLGIALKDIGELDEAVTAYRRAIALNSDFAEAHNNLGMALAGQGRLDEAILAYRQATTLNPNLAETHCNLGNALKDQGQMDEAIFAYRQAITTKPDFAEAHCNLGNALRENGQLEEAIRAYRQAITAKPGFAEAHCNLGNALGENGQLDEAIRAYRQAITIKPDFAEAHCNLGNALRENGQLEEAIRACRQAIAIKPDSAEALCNLGNALREKGQLDDALHSYREAIAIKPGFAEAHFNFGGVSSALGQVGEAIAAYRRAIALKPDYAEAHSNLVLFLNCHPDSDARAINAELRAWSQRHAESSRRVIRPHPNERNPGRRLRIGYVSPDFSRHVISHFLLPLLEAHDHASFEIFCYASVKREDEITARMKKCADGWRDVLRISDEALAEQVRADGIDVLVDLSQHTTKINRLLAFVRKPAPVQVAWLGYPGSTGLPEMDYRLTDAWMEPEGAAWSESVEEAVRLPDSWFCFDPVDEYPPVSALPAVKAGHVTFGCLNAFCKVNDAVLERWSGVMRAVEGSRLLLRCPEGATQARVREFFTARGIAAERLELIAWLPTRADFLNLFEQMDIVLDPFPYNGGATTCEALWMGIPVLTLPGERILSRLGLSILMASGMGEFVAQSEEDYVRLAVKLAADLPRLAELRGTLRGRMKASAFMDAPRFARNFEQALRKMWRAWCAKATEAPGV